MVGPLPQAHSSYLHYPSKLGHTMDAQLWHTLSRTGRGNWQPQKRSSICHDMGNRPIFYCLYLALIGSNPVLGHYMAKIHNLHFKELTPFGLKLEPSLLQLS